jgi:hypothetical protein
LKSIDVLCNHDLGKKGNRIHDTGEKEKRLAHGDENEEQHRLKEN